MREIETPNLSWVKRRQASANLGSWCAEGRTLPRKSPLWTTKITVPIAKQATNSTNLQGFCIHVSWIAFFSRDWKKNHSEFLIRLIRLRVIARHLSPKFPILSHVGWLLKKRSQENNLQSKTVPPFVRLSRLSQNLWFFECSDWGVKFLQGTVAIRINHVAIFRFLSAKLASIVRTLGVQNCAQR